MTEIERLINNLTLWGQKRMPRRFDQLSPQMKILWLKQNQRAVLIDDAKRRLV